MQAFLWRHLVPREQLLMRPQWSYCQQPATRINTDPAILAAGTSLTLTYQLAGWLIGTDPNLRLIDPPAGISLDSFSITDKKLSCTLRADDTCTAGATNLLVGLWSDTPVTKKTPRKRRKGQVLIGYLPALPIQIKSHQSDINANTR
jgi:hypothetical protein